MFTPDPTEPAAGKLRHQSLEGMIADLAGVFTDPLVVSPGGWGDTLPGWIKEQVTIERLIMNMQAGKGEQITGTDAEACAYLYTASLEAPMDHDWTEIYLYLTTRLMQKKGATVPDDIRTESISDYQQGELNSLKDWIYRCRTKARAGRHREDKKQVEVEGKTAGLQQLTIDM